MNALWRAFHSRPTVVTSEITGRESVEQVERSFPLQVERPSLDEHRQPNVIGLPERRLWRLGSYTVIDLDRKRITRPSPKFDLSIPPSTR